MKISVDFGSSSDLPKNCVAVVREVDFETSQNIDLLLPVNSLYKVDRVEAIIRTAPSAIATRPRLGLSKVTSAGVATVIRGTSALLAETAIVADVIAGTPSPDGEYMYLQNVDAATTTGLITQVATLNTPGNATITAAIIEVPRKLVLTFVDGAGSNLAGTVTITGTNPAGEVISETVTVVAGTLSYTTANAYATITQVAHAMSNGQVTVDTMDLGMSTSLALPGPYSEVTKLVSAGTVEAVSAADRVAGTFIPTTAPDGAKDFEVWYRTAGATPVITGGDSLRLVVTAGTVTGDDIRDVLVHLTRW